MTIRKAPLGATRAKGFYTLDEYLKDIDTANPGILDTQVAVLTGMFLGYCLALDQTQLSKTVCSKITDNFIAMQELLQKGR